VINERGDALDPTDAKMTLVWIARAADDAVRGIKPVRDNPASGALDGTCCSWCAATSSRPGARRLRDRRLRHAADPPGHRDRTGHHRARLVPVFSSRLSGPDGLDLVVEVAHDLRSPVTSIIFLAETLSRGQSGDINDLQRRQLRLIYSAALGLSSMASDVIELARGGDQLVEREQSPSRSRKFWNRSPTW